MNIISIIEKKKYGYALSEEEIRFVVEGIVDNSIPDYQLSALLMAIVLKGMNKDETYNLTRYMSLNGDQAKFDSVDGLVADKHSTGGVGDSTTFVVLPVIAALGIKVAKMSGRGLGHTGGTIDKLESIPNFKTELSSDEFIKIINKKGIAIIGQTLNMCTADKKLYALRDVTATVDSIPLITSSIMSKKIAGGADIITLDVKCGNGAFMQDKANAIELANMMVDIGKQAGKRVSAVVTDMNQPLDTYIGNKLEIMGAINVLKGEKNRLYEVSKVIASLIIKDALSINLQDAVIKVDEVIRNGKAYEKLIDIIATQGGDIGYIKNISEGNRYIDILSDSEGYISFIDTKELGNILVALGGGRMSLEDKIDYEVGLKMYVELGNKVTVGDRLLRVYYNQLDESIKNRVTNAIEIQKEPPQLNDLIIEVIQ